MGSHTDILFSTLCNFVTEDCEDWSPAGWCEVLAEYQGGGERVCPLHSMNGECPFRAYWVRNHQYDSCGDNLEKLYKVQSKAVKGIAESSTFVSRLVHNWRGPNSPYCCDPSTGLHAVATMALTCQHLGLYGFHGTTAVDAHIVGHDIETEHTLLRKIVDKTVPHNLFPSDLTYDMWMATSVSYGDI